MKERIKALIRWIGKILTPYKKTIIIPVLEIIAIIVICSLIVHFFSGHETLAQYADKHPEIAYQTVSDASASEEP